jgi:hypothetical protein
MIPCVPRPDTLEKKSTADRRGRIRRPEEEGYVDQRRKDTSTRGGRIRRPEEEGYVNQRSGNGVTNDKELYTP